MIVLMTNIVLILKNNKPKHLKKILEWFKDKQQFTFISNIFIGEVYELFLKLVYFKDVRTSFRL